MEAKNMTGNNSKRKGKKKANKMSIGLGGGDIGVLVVVGGALAIAGLFTTFVIKRHKRRAFSNGNANSNIPIRASQRSNRYWRKNKEEDEGLRCLLETPPTDASSSYRAHGASSTLSVIIQEDGLLTEPDDGVEIQKMVIPDYSEREIIVLSDDLCAIQDKDGVHGDSSTLSVIIQEDGLLTEPDDGVEIQKMVIPDYSEREIIVLSDDLCAIQDKDGVHGDSSTLGVIIQEDGLLTETDDGVEMQKMVIPDYSEREIIVLSDDLFAVQDKDGAVYEIPIESDEDEKEVHSVEDDEYVAENENESIGDTGNSSMDLHADEVWPAEIIEDTVPKLQTYEPQRGAVEEAKTVVADEHTHFNSDIAFNSRITEMGMKVNQHSDQSSKFRAWILSMLMVAMLLLSLAPLLRKAMSVLSLLSDCQSTL